jgi:3-hydroxyisobutyrate dehydrogenase-like beta-hydroxyacid dehydrogenase
MSTVPPPGNGLPATGQPATGQPATGQGTRVGFIGLGSQGAPIARRIVDAGFPLTLWARRPASLEPFADTQATAAASPAAMAAASDIIGLCVGNDADIVTVTGGPEGVLAGLRPGAVIAVHSTVHPDTCRALAEQAEAAGAHVVDAPVSGGKPAADVGRLLVMVGGDDATVARCAPVFATFGDPVVHLGPLGAGQVTKLLNNAAFTAHLGLAAGLFELGESLGVDPKRLAEVVLHGSGRSFALERVAAAGITLDRIAAQAGHLLAKDVGLVIDLLSADRAAAAGTGASATEARVTGESVLLAVARDTLARMKAPLPAKQG